MTIFMVAIGASLLAVMFLAMSLYVGPSPGSGVAGSSNIFTTGSLGLHGRMKSRSQHSSVRRIDTQLQQQYGEHEEEHEAPAAAA